MAHVRIENAFFSYPVYQMTGRSLKVSLVNRLRGGEGGVIEVQALHSFSLSLQDGDRVALIGRNGGGKSTLLRVIAGLAYPQHGHVEVQGRVIPLIERGLGINEELPGEANIELPLRLLGATTAEIRHAREWVPEFTGLGEFIKLPVRTYSEGMKARLAFALCTAIQGDILVLDEWLGAGDIGFVEKAERQLSDMLGRSKILVLASHSLDMLRHVCNKAAWIDNGRLVRFGEVNSVIDSYVAAMQEPEAA